MTNPLVRWSVQFRLLVLALAVGIIAMGLVSLPRMSVETLPDFEPPHVEIQTEALGLSAAEVEQLITAPMEADILNGVAYLDEIRSQSIPGLSSIELVFEPGTDIFRARQLVAERLTRTGALPKVSTPPVLMQPLSSTSRVMVLQLSSPDISLMDMSLLARWNIKPRLMGVPGVANVSIWGQREQQMQVQVDPQVLQSKGVTLDQVIKTTGNAVWVSPLTFLESSTPGTGGFLETGNQRLGIQHVLPITNPDQLATVSIEDVVGPPLTLGDVATVVEEHQPLIGDAVDEGASSLVLVVEKFPGASTLDVTAGVETAFESLAPGLSGIDVNTTVYRPASFIDSAVEGLGLGALVTGILIAAALGLMFRSWRLAVVGIVVISVSTIAAALVLFALGFTMNALVFAGLVIALAVVVGDVAADIESLRRFRSRTSIDGSETAGLTRAELIGVTLQHSRNPVAFASLTMIVAIVPALFIPDVAGALINPLVLAFIAAVATAMVVAWTLTPALGITVLTAKKAQESPKIAQRIRESYSRALQGTRGRARWSIAAGAVLAIVAVALVPGFALAEPTTPRLQDRTLLVRVDAMAGTSMGEMSRISAAIGDEVSGLDGVEGVGGHVGRAITSDRIVGANSAELWVSLTDGARFGDVSEAVAEIVDGFPGLTSTVLTYGGQQLAGQLARSSTDFAVRVYGVDIATIATVADEVRDAIDGIEGLVDPRLDRSPIEPVAEIEVDLDAAQRAAIKPGDVRRAAAALLQGLDVGFLFESQKVFQVVVTGIPSARNSLTSVQDLLIDTPNGGHVRLGDIADVRIAGNETVINHVDTSRYIDIVADLHGRSVADVSADVNEAISQIDFPREYHAEIPSAFAENRSNMLMLLGVVIAAIVGILVLIQAAVSSWRTAFVLFLTIPASLAGGVIAAVLSGGAQTTLAVVAFVALLGVAVRESVLLVRLIQTRQLGRSEFARDLTSDVANAARDRVTPTLTTLGISAIALVPIVVFGGSIGIAVILPLAVIFWGGLLTIALVTLFVLPPILMRFGAGVPTDPFAPIPVSRGTAVQEG